VNKFSRFLDFSIRDAVDSARDLANQAKPAAQKAWAYAKENPAEIILGVIALDIASSLDNIEQLEEVQTHIDVSDYLSGR
jgi:hypothetical protein